MIRLRTSINTTHQ